MVRFHSPQIRFCPELAEGQTGVRWVYCVIRTTVFLSFSFEISCQESQNPDSMILDAPRLSRGLSE